MSVGPGGRARLTYLDWLRAIALLGVFVYHCLQPFSTDDWHVKNTELSEALSIPIAFFGSWGLGFFFLISGAGACLALRWRSVGEYVTERLMRLLVPLVFAYVVLGPFQAYIEATHFGWYEGSFLSFVPRFFEEVWGQIRGIGVGSDPLLVGYMFHMWFVVFLIWYSMLGIPLFLWLRGDRGRRAIGWLGARTRIRGSTLAVAIAVSVALVIGGVDAFLEGWEGQRPTRGRTRRSSAASRCRHGPGRRRRRRSGCGCLRSTARCRRVYPKPRCRSSWCISR